MQMGLPCLFMKMITGSMENSTRQSQRPDVSAVQSQTLQNIPARVELGRLIRKVFVPEEGYVFVDADYSQIELRVLAHCSGDATDRSIPGGKGHSPDHSFSGVPYSV